MIKVLIIAFSLIINCSFGQNSDELTVEIEQGTVIGTRALDGPYYEFYGIPYADSTSGSNRFKAPSPPPRFLDVFIANRRNIKCVHAISSGYEGTEDCLVVDIFSPQRVSTELLPVMVWIKGREFDHEEHQDLSFRNLVDKDVVVVSLNYRESILGFLCLGTESAPGNAGLKDIISGLRWIQNNIVEFGGDPNSVTLFGHGSGGAAVDLVTLSPLADGLVHRAISQSGNSFAPWAVTRDPLQYAIQVAKALGHEEQDPDLLSQIFTETSVSDLMAVINELDLTDNSLAFAPCLENEQLAEEWFMIESPYRILTEGKFPEIPFIAGFVENEGTIRAIEAIEHDWLARMDASFSDFIQQDLEFGTEEEKTAIAEKVKQFYFEDESVDMSTIAEYVSYHGDTMVLVSAIRETLLRAVVSPRPVYLYQFSYEGPLGTPFVGPLSVDGAAHSEDLAYLFNNGMTTDPGSWDTIIMRSMVDRWTNFAKTGIPTSNTTNVSWEPMTFDSTNFLHIVNNEAAVNPEDLEILLIEPQSKVMDFWNDIYFEHFKDAEPIWNREDDDGVIVVETTPIEDLITSDSAETVTEPDEEEECDLEIDPHCGSVSITAGYTFLIVSLFYILNEFHQKQML